MKKAFDANVSRARPRTRLAAFLSEGGGLEGVESAAEVAVEAIARQVALEAQPVVPDLSQAVKLRAKAPRSSSAVEALQAALTAPVASAAPVQTTVVQVERSVPPPVAAQVERPVARTAPAPVAPVAVAPVRAHVEAPATVTEVQTAPPPSVQPEAEPGERRERLRERLKAVRENPRPEPLPDTVAEAGVLAVERISALQTEVTKARAMNLALSQDLEAARRQSERATEEARLRTDEARRLAKEMEGRVTLLTELERELASLESERNDALLALQEARQGLEASDQEKLELKAALTAKDSEIEESLAEEERLAAELEAAHDLASGLRRSADALKTERDTLARQVSELTRERAELLEARKALEAVHRALSSAAAR
jgi:hypothetical protein